MITSSMVIQPLDGMQCPTKLWACVFEDAMLKAVFKITKRETPMPETHVKPIPVRCGCSSALRLQRPTKDVFHNSRPLRAMGMINLTKMAVFPAVWYSYALFACLYCAALDNQCAHVSINVLDLLVLKDQNT